MQPKRMLKTILAAILILIGQTAFATLEPVPGGTLLDTDSTDFSFGGGTVVVDSAVFEYDSGDYYIYTYQISNTDAAGVSFFSVAIQPGVDATDPWANSYPLTDYVNPTSWTTSGDPVQNVNYLFGDSIDSGQMSTLLWFVSTYSPGRGFAAVYGSEGGIPLFATGSVITPVIPEPATMALLGVGGLFAFNRKKRTGNKLC